jgi:ABC-type dipeptide/oligopeptide/nickel transport system permease subunit
MNQLLRTRKILGKERPLGALISSILLFIAGIFSLWITVQGLIPIVRGSTPLIGFTGVIIPLVQTVLFLLGGFLIFQVHHLETGTFLALGLGAIFTVLPLASKTISLALLLQGIAPLVAFIIGFRTQRETRRRIWYSRIKGFWFEFSHNKIGLAGLAILLIFAFVAIFQDPIAALSYQNPDIYGLAENYAKPSWIGIIDSSSRNLPTTIDYSAQLVWNTPSPSSNVTVAQNGDMWIVSYNRTDQQKITLSANATFQYSFQPPFRFNYNFSWGAFPKVDQFGNSFARYSIEINLTNPTGRTFPLWDQYWWAVKESPSPSYIFNPNPPPDAWKDWTTPAEWWGPNRNYYPGGDDYEHFFQHQQNAWGDPPPKYDRMGYDIYDKYYNGTIPWSTSTRAVELLMYPSESIFVTARMGYKTWDTRIMTSDIFSTPGTYTFQVYVTIEATQKSGSCQVQISNFYLHIPGLVWGLLGTDYVGHDCWARLVYGARTSLMVGLSSAIIATSIGMLVGIVAGYTGGIVDEALMRLVDVMLCIPLLPLLMVLVVFFGRNILYIILIIAVFGWLGLARLVRSQVLSIREAPFIDCAKASGGSSSYIMIRHLMPNVVPIALADFILSVPGAILLEAALSFIGFGDPSAPTWGREYSIMQELGGVYISGQGVVWWWFIPPGIAITLLCVAFVFLGHALDEIVNPRLRRRR